jgi:hypothetical protein
MIDKPIKVTCTFELVDTLQLSIDCLEAAKCFRDGTHNHEVNIKKGMEALSACQTFVLDIKEWCGNFTVPKHVK